MCNRHLLLRVAVGTFICLIAVTIAGAQNPKFKILHSFAGGSDGQYPNVPLVLDSAGDLYGTAGQGGSGSGCSTGCGVIFQLIPSSTQWRERILYNFTGGYVNPVGPLAVDAKGNLYGTTSNGGSPSCNCGQVYQLSRSSGGWTQNVLYSFLGGNADGAYPESGLVRDSAGNLYGTTYSGAINFSDGIVFELTLSHGIDLRPKRQSLRRDQWRRRVWLGNRFQTCARQRDLDGSHALCFHRR